MRLCWRSTWGSNPAPPFGKPLISNQCRPPRPVVLRNGRTLGSRTLRQLALEAGPLTRSYALCLKQTDWKRVGRVPPALRVDHLSNGMSSRWIGLYRGPLQRVLFLPDFRRLFCKMGERGIPEHLYECFVLLTPYLKKSHEIRHLRKTRTCRLLCILKSPPLGCVGKL